jgi:hypothetical protein
MIRSKSSPRSDERKESWLHPGLACHGVHVQNQVVVGDFGTNIATRWDRVYRTTNAAVPDVDPDLRFRTGERWPVGGCPRLPGGKKTRALV